MEYSIKAWKKMGEKILVQTCSSAILYYSTSPYYENTTVYLRSKRDYEYIMNNNLEFLVEQFFLSVNAEEIKNRFLNKRKR